MPNSRLQLTVLRNRVPPRLIKLVFPSQNLLEKLNVVLVVERRVSTEAVAKRKVGKVRPKPGETEFVRGRKPTECR